MRFRERAVQFLRVLAVVALAAMMLVTIVDVTLRNTVNELVLGGVELVQLALVAAVFLALPETFLRDEQISIDVIDRALTPRGVQTLRAVAALLTLAFLVLLAWRMVPAALDTLVIGDLTSDLGIPFIWYWLALLIGAAASVLTQGVIVVREFASLRSAPPRSAEP